MKLHQKELQGNNKIAASEKIINIDSIGSGNIVPHWFHHKILSCGKPDLAAIIILSELWFLHRKTNGKEFDDGYSYFERKFNLTRYQMQAATLRLHKSGIVSRSFRTIVVNGRNFPNELHLKLNIGVLMALMPATSNIKNNINNSGANSSSNSNSDENSEGSLFNDEGEIFCAQVFEDSNQSSSENPEEHISNRKISIIKSRSTESSFFKNNFKEKFEEKIEVETKSNSSFASNFRTRGGRVLSEFYPIGFEDARGLQVSSGRDFDLNFINQLLLRVAVKYPDYKFFKKSAFLSYMSKLLEYEMRDAIQVSNGIFRFNSEQSAASREAARKEKYLQSVEDTKDVSLVGQLRRKIAGVFGANLAYDLLSHSSFYVSGDNSDEFTVKSSSQLALSAFQKEKLLDEIRSVYGNQIRSISILSKNSEFTKNSSRNNTNSNIDVDEVEQLPTGTWGEIRKKLISIYGKYVDKNWFSKLSASEDEENKKLTLIAPSGFIKDYIHQNYGHLIEQFSVDENFQVAMVAS